MNILLAFAMLLSVFGLLLIVMAVWDLFLRLPFVPTPAAVSQAMCAMTPWTGKETHIVDLGAGDGRLLECIRQAYPHLQADGFEISPVVWLFGVVRAVFRRSGVRMHLGSLFNADIRHADVVYLYFLPSLMNRLATKLDRELQPGSFVVSHAFRFHDRAPEKTVTVREKGKEVTVLLYRW